MTTQTIDPSLYSEQLAAKVATIRGKFRDFDAPAPEIYASPVSHFRMRAEFRLWREGEDRFYAMFDPAAPQIPIRIDHFPVACDRINHLMPEILAAAKSNQHLGHKLFQVEFLAATTQEAIVSLIYHRSLDEDWTESATQLAERLGVSIIGRSRKQRIVIGQEYVTEAFTVDGRRYQYMQIENSFTQPNAAVNQSMLSWASYRARNLGGDLLELYCGNGNFTCVLAPYFGKVLATEISKPSVRAATHNFSINGISNVEVLRMSSEEMTQAIQGVRPFRRLAHLDMTHYDLRTVFVDPPRAGLDEGTEHLVSGFDNILYVSCNPDTLANNLKSLCKTHRLEHFALFDQFPYTNHIECGVLLKRYS